MRNGVLVALLAVTTLATAGCQRLNYTKKFKLEATAIKRLRFDPPAYQQRVTVTITPTGGAVSAYLVKTDDDTRVNTALEAEKEPAASMLLGSRVSKGAAETYTFEATVPPKTEYTLFLKAGARSSECTVALIGR